MLVSSDVPQTRTVPLGHSDSRVQEAHGYCPDEARRRCEAFHRLGNKAGVLAIPRSMFAITLSNQPLGPPWPPGFDGGERGGGEVGVDRA
jgi:hypothetical protein